MASLELALSTTWSDSSPSARRSEEAPIAKPEYEQIGTQIIEDAGGASDPDPTDAPTTAATAGAKIKIAAPVCGEIVPLEELSDEVFASGMLGNGVGIVPNGGVIHSPVSGTVLNAFRTGHAYGIKTDEGVEVLIHIGVDTVSMKGAGFTAEVIAGDRVLVGDRIATVDFSKVKDAGYDPTTIILITNTKDVADVIPVGPKAVKTGEGIIEVQV
ncbi:MAG: PTS glucose transporter subunit IIA [Scrofimicrobium sp.]